MPKMIAENKRLEDKKIREIEIIPRIVKKVKKLKSDTDKLKNKNTPPPYLNNLTEKVTLKNSKKIALAKHKIADITLKNTVFPKLPAEKELKKNPAYMDYYHLIREKIRKNAYQHYESKAGGEVFLTFIILENGRLDTLYLNEESVESNELIKTALRSVQDAAPFPPFPEKLEYPKLQFNISIYFKND